MREGSAPTHGAVVAQLRAQLQETSAHRDQLQDQLSDALETIAVLEDKQAQAVNRIDWVLDSLHNVTEMKT